MDTQVERQNFTAVREVLHNNNNLFLVVLQSEAKEMSSSIITRDNFVNYFCDDVCDIQMVISSGSGVTVDTGVESRDAQ